MSATAPGMFFDPEAFREDLKIEEVNLNLGFTAQASLYAHYSGLYVMALRAESKAKLMLDVTEAKVDKALRDEAVGTGVKLTEGMIEKAITRTADVIKARMTYNEAKANVALLHGAVRAFEQRRDMLIQMGASDRHAMKGELRASAHPN